MTIKQRQEGIGSIVLLIVIVVAAVGVFLLITRDNKEVSDNTSTEQSTKRGLEKTSTETPKQAKDQTQPTNKAAGNRDIYNSYLSVKDHALTYVDEECDISMSFPQITFRNEDAYLWIVEAGKERTFVSYLGRETPTDGLDQTVILYVKKPDDTSIYRNVQLDLLCTDNKDGLSLNTYVQRKTDLLKKNEENNDPYFKELSITKLGNKTFGGHEFTGIRYATPAIEREVYLGIVNNKLYEISFSNKESNVFSNELSKVIESVVFTN